MGDNVYFQRRNEGEIEVLLSLLYVQGEAICDSAADLRSTDCKQTMWLHVPVRKNASSKGINDLPPDSSDSFVGNSCENAER